MNFLTILLAAAGLVVTRAQTQRLPETDTAVLRALCISVEERGLDLDEDSPFTYEYEQALWRLADASPEDGFEAAREKVAQFWSARHADLVCEAKGRREGILRFAVRNDFLELIEDLTERYKLDVTMPDASDGKTLVEFMAAELAGTKASQPTPAYHRLEVLYDYMKKGVKQ